MELPSKIDILSTSLKFSSTYYNRTIEYKWVGHLGNLFTSREWTGDLGQIRMIGNILFFVNDIEYPFLRCPILYWTIKGDYNMDFVRNLREAIFLGKQVDLKNV